MSGGGYRAMLFHTGAVIRLNELGLLRDMKRISSVSGGSIIAALLGLKWQQLRFREDGFAAGLNDEFVKPILEFSTHTIDKICAVIGFITQGFFVGKLLAWYYDNYLYKGATLSDLPARDAGPLFVICASNLSTGSLFRFSRPYIADWRLGRMPAGSVSLALAVAASSAFPPFLSPVRLNLKNYPVLEEDRPRPSREVDFHAVPDVLRHRAILTDGGVYDNHGLEPIDDWETIFVSDGGMPHAFDETGMWTWLSQTPRVISVMDNQVRSLRRHELIQRFRRGTSLLSGTVTGDLTNIDAGRGTYWGIGTDPGDYEDVPALPCPRERVLALSRVPTGLKDPGDRVRNGLVNWGYAICDRTLRRWHDPNIPQPRAWPMEGGL